MDNYEKYINLLIRSLDQQLPEQEQKQLEEALKRFPELAKEKEELLIMRSTIKEKYPERDYLFINSVMDAVAPPEKVTGPAFSSLLARLFPQVALASVLLILGAVLSIYIMEGQLSTEILLGVKNLTPEEVIAVLVD